MPIRRRNRFLAGIGDAAGGVGDVLMREGLRRRQITDQHKYDLQVKASQETDPAQMERLINIGKKFNLDLTPFRQSPEALLKPSFASIGGASDENNLSVNALLKQVEGFNRPDVLVRAIQTLPQAVAERGGQIQRADQGKIDQAGALARATSYASTQGTNAANNDNFPTTLDQGRQKTEQANTLDVAHQGALNPILGQRSRVEEAGRLGAQQQFGVGEFAPVNLDAAKQTTMSGMDYVDLSKFQGKQQGTALKAALDAGVAVVGKDQANALQEIDNARLNQQMIRDGILNKLPQDASGRMVTGPGNKLSAFFQTDEFLAAMGSLRTSAIQTLRAAAGSKGLRINEAEIRAAVENDIPKITDTVGVAMQKFTNIKGQLDNAESSILVRNRKDLKPGGKTGNAWDRVVAPDKPPGAKP